jgi:hypothetical protein
MAFDRALFDDCLVLAVGARLVALAGISRSNGTGGP